jgi:hypothetical protein
VYATHVENGKLNLEACRYWGDWCRQDVFSIAQAAVQDLQEMPMLQGVGRSIFDDYLSLLLAAKSNGKGAVSAGAFGVVNYRIFFKSAAGGAWKDSEIVTLQSPTRFGLHNAIQNLKLADYSILVFAGHGEYSASKRSTMLHLNSHTLIEEHEVKVGAPKRTIILDACRVHTDAPFNEMMVKSALGMEGHQDPAIARALFDGHVAECHPGLAVLYSCSIGQGAGDIKGIGGEYSSAIIQIADDWAPSVKAQHGSVLSISDVHEMAVPIVSERRGGDQVPIASFPRNIPRFPFAVRG